MPQRRTGKILAAFLFLAAAMLPLAAGCSGPGGSDAGGRVRLTLMLPPSERPAWTPIVLEFEKAHPGTLVDLVEGPNSTDLRENLYTAALLARDSSFDLIYMDVTWTSKFAAAGWLRPLDKAFPRERQAELLEAAVDAGKYRGRLYRVPVRTDVGLLFYRADWLKEAGFDPPRTFEDLHRIAAALQDPPDRWGFVWQGKQYEGLVCDYLEVLRGFGGFWIRDEDLEVGLDQPQAIAALDFLVRCRNDRPISPPGVTTYQEEESRRIFQDGRCVFLRNWPYVWRLAQAESSPLRGRVGARSMVHAPSGRSAGTLGGWGFAVSSYSRHPELAEEFIRFTITSESQRILCRDTGFAPARKDSYEDSVLLRADPFLTEIRRVHEDAVARPAVASYALVSDVLQRHLSSALTGATTAERALRAAARETRLILAGRRKAEAGRGTGATQRMGERGAARRDAAALAAGCDLR